jgi:hypothetical protein
MLITYFKDPRILARYRSGLANIYLEDFITWLESQSCQSPKVIVPRQSSETRSPLFPNSL